jgi:hypothetical protein
VNEDEDVDGKKKKSPFRVGLMFGIRQNWVIPCWNVQDWRIPASDSVIIIFNVFFFFFSFFSAD